MSMNDITSSAPRMTRRTFHRCLALAGAAALPHLTAPHSAFAAPTTKQFTLRYMLASSLYGYTDVDIVAAQVRKVGATALDIWPKVHGNQREQLDAMGEQKFRALLKRHQIELGCITQFKLGPFHLQDEMRLAQRLGCHLIVTGGKGPRGLSGTELKQAVAHFVEQMKPHLAIAEETGVTIAIENHSNNLIESPDALKWLAELAGSKPLGIALAPYHLPQDEKLLSDLIRSLGNRIKLFYAWQHGMGCMKKLPKAQELLQLPGLGKLDFRPLLAALKDIQYGGFTEIFMHPVPRGIPILPSTVEVTAEINRARRYLQRCLDQL